MGSKQDDTISSDASSTEPTQDVREGEGALRPTSPTRRHFIVGLSGVLVGAAACDGDGDGGVGASGGSGGASAASGGAKAVSTGGAPTSTGGTASATGGTPGATGGSSSASGGAAGSNGGAANATGGTPANGGTASSSGGASTSKGGSATVSGGTSGANGGTATSSGGAATAGAPSGGTGGSTARKTASDRVMLGSTGIEVSRLAMGSGTVGTGRGSNQSRLGVEQFSGLLVYAYEQGITFYETADAYGTHPHVAEAIRKVGRENVVVLTKTTSETAAGVEADLARFRTELGIDMIDIVLLHLKTNRNWVSQCEAAMGVLDKAKQSGAIRAHGVSCHSIDALRLAAQTPWVDVDLARVNPAGVVMDAEPTTVIDVLREMKTGQKGVIGMKILGEGQLANRLDECIKHAVNLDAIDCFTIGFTSQAQLDEVIQKIAAV
jgi:aryl-alcohol dehydrogenase-like predicted oxidoreductase